MLITGKNRSNFAIDTLNLNQVKQKNLENEIIDINFNDFKESLRLVAMEVSVH